MFVPAHSGADLAQLGFAPDARETPRAVFALDDFDTIFRRFAPYVARISFRILGRADEVDDVIQDVFLDAYRGLAKLRDADAIRGWLATVTVRKARKQLRRRRLKHMLRLDDTPDYNQVADPGASPEQRALLAAIYRHLDRLPTDQRMAWTLRHVEGNTLPKVAELCDCSLATAKRRIRAAAEAIEKALDD